MLAVFQTFHYYYICYGDRWWVIFDVTIVIGLGGGSEPRPYKMVKLIDKCCVCSDCSTDRPFPVSLPLLGPPYSLRHNNIEITPLCNPTMASKHSSERKSLSMWQTSLWSYFKKFPQPPHLQQSHPPQSSAISTEARPSTSKRVRTHWRLRWWLAFFGNAVLFN